MYFWKPKIMIVYSILWYNVRQKYSTLIVTIHIDGTHRRHVYCSMESIFEVSINEQKWIEQLLSIVELEIRLGGC